MKQTLILTAALLVMLLCACSGGQKPADADDELRIFSLVAEPASEGDYPTALRRADSLLSHVAMGDTLKAYIMIERSTALFNSGNYGGAASAADSLIAFSRARGIKDVEIQALANKGSALRREGRYDEGIGCISQALQMASETGNTEQEQNLADQLAVIYVDLGRATEAEALAERALRLATELDDEVAVVGSASTYGSVLTTLGRYREAVAALQPWRDAALRGHPVYTVKYLTPLFTSYIKLDSLDRAGETIALAEKAAEPLGRGHISHAVILQAKAQLAHARGDYAGEYAIYEQLDSVASHGKRACVSLFDRAVCMHGMGYDGRAFELMKNAYESLDSVRTGELQKQLSDLSVSYGTLQKDIEIERLARQRVILWAAVVSAVLLLCLIVVVSVALRRRAVRRHHIERQRQYVAGLEAEQCRVARELHDDVAGRLTALRLSLPTLEADAVAESLSSLGESVRSLSHRMMAPEFETTSLTQLLLELVRRFRELHPGVEFSISDEGSFDWSALGAGESHELYRIVQEAVNNALRHAVPVYIKIILDGDSRRLSLKIINDGMDPQLRQNAARHRTMSARAALIGAEVAIECREGIYTVAVIKNFENK